jgi:hypothetical protein
MGVVLISRNDLAETHPDVGRRIEEAVARALARSSSAFRASIEASDASEVIVRLEERRAGADAVPFALEMRIDRACDAVALQRRIEALMP